MQVLPCCRFTTLKVLLLFLYICIVELLIDMSVIIMSIILMFILFGNYVRSSKVLGLMIVLLVDGSTHAASYTLILRWLTNRALLLEQCRRSGWLLPLSWHLENILTRHSLCKVRWLFVTFGKYL